MNLLLQSPATASRPGLRKNCPLLRRSTPELVLQTAQIWRLRTFPHSRFSSKIGNVPEKESKYLTTYPSAGLVGSQLKISLSYWKMVKRGRKRHGFILIPHCSRAILARIILKDSFSRNIIRGQLSFCDYIERLKKNDNNQNPKFSCAVQVTEKHLG